MFYPTPKVTTEYRVIGPTYINGMKTWAVYNLHTKKQIGPVCFSTDEARERIRDDRVGKVWFGGTRLTRRAI